MQNKIPRNGGGFFFNVSSLKRHFFTDFNKRFQEGFRKVLGRRQEVSRNTVYPPSLYCQEIYSSKVCQKWFYPQGLVKLVKKE
jgi:hypothetical protein